MSNEKAHPLNSMVTTGSFNSLGLVLFIVVIKSSGAYDLECVVSAITS